MAGRLGQTDVARNDRREDLAGKVPPHLLCHLIGEIRAAVVHRQQHAEHADAWVQPPLDGAQRGHQVAQALQREIFALHGDQHAVRRAQGVERQQLQRGRAVDEDIVVFVLELLQRVFQTEFALLQLDQLHARAREVGAGGDDVAEVGVDDGFFRGNLPDDHLIGAVRRVFFVHAEARGGVCLRVKIAEQNAGTGGGQRRGEVDGGGGFPDAALLIDDCNDPCHNAASFSGFMITQIFPFFNRF